MSSSSGLILLNNSKDVINVEYLDQNNAVRQPFSLLPGGKKGPSTVYSIARGYICSLSCRGTAPSCDGQCPRNQVTLNYNKGGPIKDKLNNTIIDCGAQCLPGNKALCCALTDSFSHIISEPGTYLFDGETIVGPVGTI
jgi:hypothetical protein